MADRPQKQTSKAGMEKQRRGEHEPVVGRDVPDESKEHHTEIAVEAGRKGGERHGDKH